MPNFNNPVNKNISIMAKVKTIKIKNFPKKKAAAASGAGQSPALANRVKVLDSSARAWLRLLSDPCGADLVESCYAGTGTGYLSRVRTVVVPPANAVDWLMEFRPGSGWSQAIRYGYSSTPNGSLGTGTNYAGGGFLSSTAVGRARCIAACVKLIYTGTETNRSGYVSYGLDQGATILLNETIEGAAGHWASTMAHSERMGARDFEFKWVPGPGDEDFRATRDGSEEVWTNENRGAGVTLAVVGAPAGTFQAQITSVWEWQPEEENIGGPSGLVVANRAPRSANTLNDVLRAIGDIGKFAASSVSVAYPGWAPAMNTAMAAVSAGIRQLR